MKHFLKGQIAMEDVRRELMAQAAKMEKTGLPLTHVDSHQHMHMLPGVIDISLDVASSLHLDAVRISRTPLFTAFAGMGQLIGRLGLFTLSELSSGRRSAVISACRIISRASWQAKRCMKDISCIS